MGKVLRKKNSWGRSVYVVGAVLPNKLLSWLHKSIILLYQRKSLKSDNLQYITAERWDDSMIVSPSDGPMFFFIDWEYSVRQWVADLALGHFKLFFTELL